MLAVCHLTPVSDLHGLEEMALAHLLSHPTSLSSPECSFMEEQVSVLNDYSELGSGACSTSNINDF